MARIIQELFINPPIAVARLGGSTNPQDAYRWVESPNPRSSGETVVAPDWTLTVRADGGVDPIMPDVLHFRDGALIRPVAPFLEIWARVGEPGSAAGTWRDAAVTPAMLAAQGVSLADVLIRVTAVNGKVARRTGNAALRFGTFPPVEVRADDNRSVPLLASSPSSVARPMIPRGRSIPLGSVQVLRSRPQPAAGSTPWRDVVNIEQLRIRFTPARGHVYGPPQSAQPNPTPRGDSAVPVESTRAFLNGQAGWADARFNPPDQPGDTYDGSDVGNNHSLGVVDDTCEARIDVSIALPQQGGRVVSAAANVFVAPPDFAPDRRPFLSLADELNDRSADAGARNAALAGADLDAWVEDLFERIQETVALLNVDLWRSARAATLTGAQLAQPIADDATPQARNAMGGRDTLRNRLFALPAPNVPDPLPLTRHARMRHRALSDLQALRGFIRQNPGRLRELIRRPFEIRANEDPDNTTMAMPPFMRNSNAQPLTLSVWQYELLMKWVADVEAGTGVPGGVILGEMVAADAGAALGGVERPLSDAAAQRRDQVLKRVRAGGPAP